MNPISYLEALAILKKNLWEPKTEEVVLDQSTGRVLAEDVYTDRSYPPFNRAAMDGVAFKYEDYIGKPLKILEQILAGDVPIHSYKPGHVYKIMTGAAVPFPADTVVRIEDCELREGTVLIHSKQIMPWQNIAPQGEDALKGELVLQKNTLINTGVIAVLASVGKARVSVYKKPRVRIISTGTEIKRIDHPEIKAHEIRNSNSFTIKSLLQKLNISVESDVLVPDDEKKMQEAIERGMDGDILILSGGVSMGEADYVPKLLGATGVHEKFHKVAIKPGKPVYFGCSPSATVFALPGNPMSCIITFELFVERFILSSYGIEQTSMYLPVTEQRKQRTKFDEFFPAKLVYTHRQELSPHSIMVAEISKLPYFQMDYASIHLTNPNLKKDRWQNLFFGNKSDDL